MNPLQGFRTKVTIKDFFANEVNLTMIHIISLWALLCARVSIQVPRDYIDAPVGCLLRGCVGLIAEAVEANATAVRLKAPPLFGTNSEAAASAPLPQQYLAITLDTEGISLHSVALEALCHLCFMLAGSRGELVPRSARVHSAIQRRTLSRAQP